MAFDLCDCYLPSLIVNNKDEGLLKERKKTARVKKTTPPSFVVLLQVAMMMRFKVFYKKWRENVTDLALFNK